MNVYRFTSGGSHPCLYELFWSKVKARPRVRVVSEDWDYEDEADAADLSAEVSDCRTLADAAERLGLAGDASDTWADCHPALG